MKSEMPFSESNIANSAMASAISLFLSTNKVITLSTCAANHSHSAICFYSYDKATNSLLIKSSEKTKHVENGLLNPESSGTILPNIQSIAKIQGIQFTALFQKTTANEESRISSLYYKTYPMALAIKGTIWVLKLLTIKLTDNTLGFGKKHYWERKVQ
jgi:uncharacterized protein YhbP (UPF0306 family)